MGQALRGLTIAGKVECIACSKASNTSAKGQSNAMLMAEQEKRVL
jgi:hypothetical protein